MGQVPWAGVAGEISGTRVKNVGEWRSKLKGTAGGAQPAKLCAVPMRATVRPFGRLPAQVCKMSEGSRDPRTCSSPFAERPLLPVLPAECEISDAGVRSTASRVCWASLRA